MSQFLNRAFGTRPAQRIYTGPDATEEFDRLKKKERRASEYPYEWISPPPESIRVHQKASIAPPAATTETLVLSYEVQGNYKFYLTGLFQQLIGGTANVPGDGQIAWNWTINTTVGAITATQGYYLQGFTETLSAGSGNFPLGNFQGGFNSPYVLAKPEELGPHDILRNTVIVNSTVSAGGGRFVSLIDGWLVKL